MTKKTNITTPLTLIDYGAGNTRSVEYALRRLGVECLLTRDPEEIIQAEKVIFPGVGHAEAAMNDLQKYELDKLIPQLTQPVLGICLGMQLLGKYSEEGNVDTLGIMDFKVQKFVGEQRIPHMGWNQLQEVAPGFLNDIQAQDRVYFVHSYYVPLVEETIAQCDYITPFSAAVQKGNFTGCQFHPEKSGEVGARILRNFLDAPSLPAEKESLRKESQ